MEMAPSAATSASAAMAASVAKTPAVASAATASAASSAAAKSAAMPSPLVSLQLETQPRDNRPADHPWFGARKTHQRHTKSQANRDARSRRPRAVAAANGVANCVAIGMVKIGAGRA